MVFSARPASHATDVAAVAWDVTSSLEAGCAEKGDWTRIAMEMPEEGSVALSADLLIYLQRTMKLNECAAIPLCVNIILKTASESLLI